MSSQLDPVKQRYQRFCDQNVEKGHFDVTFQFGMTTDSEGNYVNNENEPIQQLHAHSFALWPSSEVFEKTLFGPLAHKGPIQIIRHSFADFKEFITFLYLGQCTITINNVMALVDLGEYYEVKLLKDQCDEFLTQNSAKIENVLKVYESLKIYSLENALAKVIEFIVANAVEILKTDEFLGAKKEIVLDIAKIKNLNAKQEEVFEAICKWGDHNCPEDTVNKNEFLKSLLADFIPLIDFTIMNLGFLNNFVDRRVIFTDENHKKAYADIFDQAAITAIESMITQKTNHMGASFCRGDSSFCQWGKAIVGSIIPQFYFIRNQSGYPVLTENSRYNQNSISVNSVIAPVYLLNGTFDLKTRCKIEFA